MHASSGTRWSPWWTPSSEHWRNELTGSWILTCGTGIVLAAPIAARVLRRRFDPFEPLFVFVLAYGVMFVVRPAAMLKDDELSFWGLDLHGTLPLAVLLGFMGAVAFVCGYELSLGSALARRFPTPAPLDTRALLTASSAVAALGLVVLIVFLPASDPVKSLSLLLHGRSDELRPYLLESSTYLWYGSWLFVPASLVLVGAALRHRRPYLWLAAAIALALAFLRTVPLGSRIALLPLVGGIVVLLYVMRGRRPGLRTMIVFAFVALLGSYTLAVVRDTSDPDKYRNNARTLLHRPDALFYPLLHGEDAEMADALASALTVVPDDLGYRYGRSTVGELFVRPIPRELWSGKPLPGDEQVVKRIWPDLYPWLNPTFTPLLTFYWDFGVVGVVVGMALFGLLARSLYAWFLANKGNFASQLVFAASLWFIVIGVRNDTVDTIIFATFLVLPVLVIVAVSRTGGTLANLLARTHGSDAEPQAPTLRTGDAVRR